MASFWLVAVLLGAAARGQVGGQYIVPGSLARIPESPAERARRAAEEARWRWGPLRIEPRLSLSNVGYQVNVLAASEQDEQSDLRATVGAGLAAYMRLGPKTVAAGFVTPQYDWWRKLEELRELSTDAGLGLFGFFNRLELSARATATEREGPLSGELDIPVRTATDNLQLEVQVELRPRLAVRSRGSASEYRLARDLETLLPGVRLGQLERDTEIVDLELVLELRTGFELGLGVRRTDIEFLNDPGGRSTRGTSPVVSIALEGRRTRVVGTLALNDLEYRNPELGRFEAETGSIVFALEPNQPTQISLYGIRNLAFGAQVVDSTLEESRVGATLGRRLGRRIEAHLTAEVGELVFNDPHGVNAGRSDDVTVFGAGLELDLTQKLALRFDFSDIEYDSNLPEFDRATTRLLARIDVRTNLLPWYLD